MKRSIIILALVTLSMSAFAQFPLGGNLKEIKAYFAQNIPYASIQKFKTEEGVNAVTFTKVRVIGDYTFYFDNKGTCSSYVVTYDKKELSNLLNRFDAAFVRVLDTKWQDPDKTYDVRLDIPKNGENYFSITYTPTGESLVNGNTLAAN